MYPKWMIYLSRYFDFFGFYSGLAASSPRYWLLIRVLFICHIIVGIILTLSTFKFLFRPITNRVGTINDDVKLLTALFVYWSSNIELYLKRGTQQKFWQRLNQIDEQFCSHQEFFLRKFLIRMVLLLSIVSFILAEYSVREIPKSPDTALHLVWINTVVLIEICLNRLFCHLFYMELIAHELEMIEGEVKEIARQVTIINATSRLEKIREYYQLVWGMTIDINRAFSWSNLPTILFPLELVLTDANWMFYNTYHAIPLRAGGLL